MDVMWAITVVDHLQQIDVNFNFALSKKPFNYLGSMMLEGLFEIVSHLSSWDCTIKTVDWRVNCENLDVVYDEASQHNCLANFG